MSKTNEHLQYHKAGRIRKRSVMSTQQQLIGHHFVVTLRSINTNISYFSCHQALSLHNSGKKWSSWKKKGYDYSRLRVPCEQSQDLRRYPDNLPPGQFASDNSLPTFKQLAPHSFIQYRAKRVAKYMNPRLNVVQIILRSFVHYRTNYCSFFYPLPSLKIGGELSGGELSRGRVVWHLEMHHPSCFMHWGCSLVDPQLWQLLDNVMMKLIINNKTDTWKTDINLLIFWIICLVTLLIFVLRHTFTVFPPSMPLRESRVSIRDALLQKNDQGLSGHFHSSLLSDLAWQQGWRWPCFDTDLSAFVV